MLSNTIKLVSMELIRHHFDMIDSTNTWAKNHAHTFVRDKVTLITADQQTAGKGRFKRTWTSPPAQNIYASFCLFLEKHRKDMGNIPQVLALSAAKILESLSFQPVLKWPNDVLLSNKKVAGILAESTPLSDQLCLIIGIGLNINMPESILQTIDRPATSLLVEKGHPYEIETVLELLQRQFLIDLDTFLEKGFHSFLDQYKHLLSKQKQIRFHDNRMVWEGEFHQINDDGSLSLILTDGTTKTFFAGEILWPGE